MRAVRSSGGSRASRIRFWLVTAVSTVFVVAPLAVPQPASGSHGTSDYYRQLEDYYRQLELMRETWYTSTTPTPVTTVTSSPAVREAGFATGDFSELDMSQANNGFMAVDATRAYGGYLSAQATVYGGVGAQYARGGFAGPWSSGEQVVYRAAFFFPAGFYASLTNQTDIMRFDNWDDRPTASEQTGLTIKLSRAGKKLMIFRNQLGAGGAGITYIAGPFELPTENAWHQLEVRQTLSPFDGMAYNALYVDGALQGSSTSANMFGNPGNRYNWFRAGIVASGTNQTSPVSLWFDELRLARL